MFGVTVKDALHWYWLTPLTVIEVRVAVAVLVVRTRRPVRT